MLLSSFSSRVSRYFLWWLLWSRGHENVFNSMLNENRFVFTREETDLLINIRKSKFQCLLMLVNQFHWFYNIYSHIYQSYLWKWLFIQIQLRRVNFDSFWKAWNLSKYHEIEKLDENNMKCAVPFHSKLIECFFCQKWY